MPVEVECQICGNAFTTQPSVVRRGHGKYCSIPCRTAGLRKSVRRQCETCGIAMDVPPCKINVGHGRFCSKACFHKSTERRVLRTCKNCGKTMEIARSHAAMGRYQFCSRACRNEWGHVQRDCLICGSKLHVHRSQAAEGKGLYCSRECYSLSVPAPVYLSCAYCGKHFRVRNSMGKRGHKFCSTACMGKAWMGSNHPRWKGGRKGEYRMAETPSGTRPAHRVAMEKYLGRTLQSHEHVHHRNRNPGDNRIENLRVLTRSEHMMIHQAEDKLTRVLQNILTQKQTQEGVVM